MESFIRILVSVVIVLVVAGGALMFWASAGWDRQDLEQAEVLDLAAPEVTAGMSLKVMTWNIGFGGGPQGGPTDRHPGAEITQNLAAIAQAIRGRQPDVVFIQEIDRPSSRTGQIDQVEFLLRSTGLPHACFVSTWKTNYVPFPYFPMSGHIGAVHSGQVVLSRFPISECRRIPLPQPAGNAWWYNRFFLHRALQHVILDLGDAPGRQATVDVINVHLEAFSQENRQQQAAILKEYVADLPAGRPLVIAGDFNSIPPYSVQVRGFKDEDVDFSGDDTIDKIRGIVGLREVIIDETPGLPANVFNTFPAVEPTRRLDYVFHRGFIGSILTLVPRKMIMSDHLPVITELLF